MAPPGGVPIWGRPSGGPPRRSQGGSTRGIYFPWEGIGGGCFPFPWGGSGPTGGVPRQGPPIPAREKFYFRDGPPLGRPAIGEYFGPWLLSNWISGRAEFGTPLGGGPAQGPGEFWPEPGIPLLSPGGFWRQFQGRLGVGVFSPQKTHFGALVFPLIGGYPAGTLFGGFVGKRAPWGCFVPKRALSFKGGPPKRGAPGGVIPPNRGFWGPRYPGATMGGGPHSGGYTTAGGTTGGPLCPPKCCYFLDRVSPGKQRFLNYLEGPPGGFFLKPREKPTWSGLV